MDETAHPPAHKKARPSRAPVGLKTSPAFQLAKEEAYVDIGSLSPSAAPVTEKRFINALQISGPQGYSSEGLLQIFGEPLAPNALLPKVSVSSHVPLPIEIERRKRLYAQLDIEDLLMSKNGYTLQQLAMRMPWDIHQHELPSSSFFKAAASLVSLDVFDDGEHDSRSSSEWLELGVDQSGRFTFVPAKALRCFEDGVVEWQFCKVMSFSADSRRYRCIFASDSAEVYRPRIFILFLAENPYEAVRRIDESFKLALNAEKVMKQNLVIDCMPIDGAPSLSPEQLHRICALALSNSKQGQGPDSTSFIAELSNEYSRISNFMVYSSQYHSQEHGEELLPLEEPIQINFLSNKRTSDMPPHDFPHTFSAFHFASLLTVSKVISCLQKIRAENLKVEGIQLYNLKFNKTLRVEEYEQMQSLAFQSAQNQLRDSWVTSIKNIIKYSLKDIGKGWFDLKEERIQIYMISKLRHLMTTIRFMMQDSLRNLAETSLHDVSAYFKNFTNFSFKVNSFGSCVAELKPGCPPTRVPNPLFLVELAVSSQGDVYVVQDLQQLKQLVLSSFDRGITAPHGIPQMDQVVLDRIVWSEKLYLDALSKSEPIVSQVREQVAQAMDYSISFVQQFIQLYREFEDVLQFKSDEINHDSSSKPEEEVFKDVMNLQRRRLDASERLSINSVVGLYILSCESVRKAIFERMDQMTTLAMSSFAERVRAATSKCITEYEKIHEVLKKVPANVEEIAQIKEFISGLQPKLEECLLMRNEVNALYERLDSFHYNYTKDDVSRRWQVFGSPFSTVTLIDECQIVLREKQMVFEGLMMEEQSLFTAEIADLDGIIATFSRNNDLGKVEEICATVKKLQRRLADVERKAKHFNSREALFERPPTDYSDVQRVARNLEPYQNFWICAYDWIKSQSNWLDGDWTQVDGEEMERNIGNWLRNIAKASKFFNDRYPDIGSLCTEIRNAVENFKQNVPLVQALRSNGIRDRHWDAMKDILGFSIKPDDSFTLRKAVEEMKLLEKVDSIVKICDNASKEYGIETALDKMEAAWSDVNLDLSEYKATGTFVLRGVDEIFQLLDDHIVMTQSMSFSPFKKPFEERIIKWEEKLRLCQDIIDELIQVQKLWMYLEPIFGSDDIKKQLPAESKKFEVCDRNWRRAMQTGKNTKHCLTYCSSKSLLTNFRDSNRVLDVVQKGLSDYLETKRAAFARFYFLSNDELLEILSQTKDVELVQPHLKKCFEAINRIEFNKDGGGIRVLSMSSIEKETIQFSAPLQIKGSVEFWLKDVENCMRDAVRRVLKEATNAYVVTPRPDWVISWPGQTVLNISQHFWSMEVGEAITSGGYQGVEAYFEKMLAQIDDLVTLVRGELSFLASLTLGALIVVEVHAREVVSTLIQNKISSIDDFDWMSQLRYYWETDETHGNAKKPLGFVGGSNHETDAHLVVRQVQALFIYGYEYLGNSARLVITPLTDRCYITLTGAMHLSLGGAPQGPAGTGKTETTKDLGKALAKQCVVFNCSDGLDYKAMGKFFKGLASAGAWSCFDEFNRIDVEVLSVIAQQITTIQKAIVQKVLRFMFEGSDIPLDCTTACFITMNPGYAGRTELPDNLKALFRPMAMMVPDYTLIAEISLFSFGFGAAKALAQKITSTFKLSSEQLSSQDHYDFGMRAVKTVISAAGILKRAEPQTSEPLLLLRALQDVNKPKFLSDDLVLFDGIISDLFPGVERPPSDYGRLMQQIDEECRKLGLEPTPTFCSKVIQLYETTVVRHGLMTVGPTAGGKTSNFRVLQAAMTACKKKYDILESVESFVLNPKSITMGQLYGSFDENTHEWADGILPGMIRRCALDSTSTKKWVMFDGPVDALWIESMNTVLDDNKKLCLVSGEIISLSASMTMMFEVEDLSVASPATVSRCGMIYMEPRGIGNAVLGKCWVRQLPEGLEAQSRILDALFEKILLPTLAFVRSNLTEIVVTVDSNLVASFTKLFDSMAKAWLGIKLAAEKSEDEEQKKRFIPAEDFAMKNFIFSLIWSVGASIKADGRQKFDTFVKELLATNADIAPPSIYCSERSLYDWTLNLSSKRGEWLYWMDTVPAYNLDLKRTDFSKIIVPTLDGVRNSAVVKTLVQGKKHVLCVGNTGTGKTLGVVDQLVSLDADQYMTAFMAFSASTSANQTQDILDSKFDKRRKGVFGPPLGKHFVIFVDDLNMPAREKYFAQPPIELLRQWLDHGGWYDRKTLTFMSIVDLILVGAMGPPGGGRNPVTPRLLRHFNFVAFTDLSKESLLQIFRTILGSFVSANLGKELQPVVSQAVDATIEIYETISKELLPTPNKSHYTFNLRDLAKVFQGCLCADPSGLTDVNAFVRLWIHENSRVFQDRLVDDTDREWFSNLMRDVATRLFKIDWTVVNNVPKIMFGDYTEPSAETKKYQQVVDLSRVVRLFEEYLEDYNGQSQNPMKLTMFLDAIDHVSRIARIIRQPMGHALLLGVGGSGRQSLSKLAAFMSDFNSFQIQITKSYGKVEWRDDLKKLLLASGVEAKATVFLFTDTQIVKEFFVEDINGILSSGEVPNLLDGNDLETVSTAMRPLCQAAGIAPTKNALYGMFIARVKTFLHVVLCFSPYGDVYRARLRMYPSLLNCCTIDWFSEWPEDALRSVARKQLETLSFQSDEISASIIEMCKFIHQSVSKKSDEFFAAEKRFNAVTPTSYLELLGTYKRLSAEKTSQVTQQRDRLQNGYTKLISCAEVVATMQIELEDMQPVLKKTVIEVEELMVVIAKDKEDAAVTKISVERDEASANEKATKTKAIADDAQRDLDEALPALEAAVKALKSLNKNDIVEVKSMKNPPAGVKLVMETVCIMQEIKPVRKDDPDNVGKKINDYWEPGSKLLNDPNAFLKSLFDFDKDTQKPEVIKQIEPYIVLETFTPEAITKVSKACTSICLWVRAMHKYYHIARNVEPKRIALREAQESLDITLKQLAEAKEKLRLVTEKLERLESEFSASVAKKEALAAKIALCTVQLERANKLIGGLGGERVRWGELVGMLNEKLTFIVGDVLVAAASVDYLGAFTGSYRQALIKSWLQEMEALAIPHSSNASLHTVLADPPKIREWNIAGLPSDSLSIENAIILTRSRRWGLMIDPETQANRWLKNLEKSNSLEVIKLSQKEYLRTLENGIRFGRPILLENVGEELDPALEPVLLKLTNKVNGADVIKLGGNDVPYHPDFRFYITTKLRNPYYKPETAVKIALLNFAITPDGLQEQLLGIVVSQERPDLSELKNRLVVQNANMKTQMSDIETKILSLLASAGGDILEDEALINTLADAKVTSNEINIKLKEAEETEKQIDDTRSKYIPVAYSAMIQYFCISSMSVIDPMYQYSLTWFQELFRNGIGNTEASSDFEVRMNNLIKYFMYSLYVNICRSLFETHKLLFSFLLCVRVMIGDHKVDESELRFLLSGATSTDIPFANPASSWLTASSWMEVANVSRLSAFAGFAESFRDNVDHYRAYFDDPLAHRHPLAQDWSDKLSQLQRMLIVRCLRPDKISSAVQDLVAAELGQRFIEPPPFDLAGAFKDSSVRCPLIFVFAAGSDPASDFYRFAEETGMTRKMDSISLGQGQGPIAEAMIATAQDRGGWVFLQNVHLAVSWMPSLERIFEQIDPDKVHRDFRLWLTSMPSKQFPVNILQDSVKLTVEPPKGLKANLVRSYIGFTDEFLVDCKKPKEWAQLLYGVCFLHAIVQDRRRFGPLGWNVAYDFSQTDLQVSALQLQMFLNDSEEIPYKVLRFLVGEINYGGRVTDDKDRRALNTMVHYYVAPETLAEGASFSGTAEYNVPVITKQSEAIAFLRSLPLNPHPNVFGLHENADITSAINETDTLFANMVSMSQSGGAKGGAGTSKEDIVTLKANDILSRIPASLNVAEAAAKYPVLYNESLNTVLVQEVIRFNRLLETVNKSLKDVLRAMKGIVVMSESLELISTSVFNNQVPDAWFAVGYPSLKPLASWVVDLEERLAFVKKWIDYGHPSVFWISGFFFPQAFMTGVLQASGHSPFHFCYYCHEFCSLIEFVHRITLAKQNFLLTQSRGTSK
jgi:dynein heavy chain